MAQVTYSAVATAPAGHTFYTNPGSAPVITASITGPANELTPITFALQNDVNPSTTLASLKAVFPSPTWALSPTITNVIPTFIFWPNANGSVPLPVAAAAITTLDTQSTIAASVFSTATSDSTSFNITKSSTNPTGSQSPFITTPTGSPSPSTSTKIHQGYSAGELAGAAVGCLVGGLLIASVLAVFFLRLRSRPGKHTSKTEKDPSIHEVHGESMLVEIGTTKVWRGLPQSDSDGSIGHLASRTLDEIEIFVEEFYTNQSTLPLGIEFAKELSPFDSPYLPKPLVDLLRDNYSRTVLTKHCIAYFLLQKIDPSPNDPQSLLPKEYILPRLSESFEQESRQEVSQLRVLMAKVRSAPEEDKQYLAQRDQVSADAVQQIELAFRPWARGEPGNRANALKGIIVHVSELGIKLFTQPASFQWQWRQPSLSGTHNATKRDAAKVMMLPGLNKITDSKAELLASPICLVKPRPGF